MADLREANLGLYYPFIQFRSDVWLKLAALYWDQVGRIVPPGYMVEDSETVRRLQGELGFVTDLSPSISAMDEVGGEFLDLIHAYDRELGDLYGIRDRSLANPPHGGQQWPAPWSNLALERARASQWQGPVDPSLRPDADPRLAYIYSSGKMTQDLEQALVDSGLGLAFPAHGLIGLNPKLAFVYMHVLASRMAGPAMSPLTDDAFDHVASGCAAGRIAEALLGFPGDPAAPGDSAERPAVEFAILAIQSVIPKDIGSIPVEKIIDVRRNHPEELARFQETTKAIVASVPEAIESADPQVCAMYLQALQDKTLKPELHHLKESLARAGIDGVLGAMSVKVQAPQLMTSAAALLGIGAMHLNPVMVGAGAIVLCLVPRIRQQRIQAQRIRAGSPASYLLRLEEELNPASLASSTGVKARQFLAA